MHCKRVLLQETFSVLGAQQAATADAVLDAVFSACYVRVVWCAGTPTMSPRLACCASWLLAAGPVSSWSQGLAGWGQWLWAHAPSVREEQWATGAESR